MAEIIWTMMVVEDLENIAEYIAIDSEYYAAVKHYERERDIISTQRYLGHGSVGITQGYLAGLDCRD